MSNDQRRAELVGAVRRGQRYAVDAAANPRRPRDREVAGPHRGDVDLAGEDDRHPVLARGARTDRLVGGALERVVEAVERREQARVGARGDGAGRFSLGWGLRSEPPELELALQQSRPQTRRPARCSRARAGSSSGLGAGSLPTEALYTSLPTRWRVSVARAVEQAVKPTQRLAAALLVASTGYPAALGATEPSPSTFDGVWRHAPGPEETRRRQASIEAATEDLSIFMRGKARDRLDERTTPPRVLQLQVRDDRVELSRDGKSVSLRVGAKPVTVERNGQRAILSVRLDRAQLVLHSKGERGERTTTYALSPDGRGLTMSVRMTSERLGAPLEYRSTYRRE